MCLLINKYLGTVEMLEEIPRNLDKEGIQDSQGTKDNLGIQNNLETHFNI